MLNNKVLAVFAKYPVVSQRGAEIISLSDAVKAEGYSLSRIDKIAKEDVTVQWLKGQLIDIMRFCGAFDVANETQIIVTAKLIRKNYFYLTLPELSCFFERFISGTYGMLYVGKSINCQTIMQAVKDFENEVINQRMLVEEEKDESRRKEEQRLINEGKTGINAWLKYCHEHGIKDQPLPMQGFLHECKRKKFNAK